MTASSCGIRSVGPHSNFNEAPLASSPSIIDFFEARHRLLTESESIAQKSEMDRQISPPAVRRERSVDRVDAFEQGYYWLIWAAVLAGLVLGIFDF
jgi:hypothetical protein